ncbi:Uncharacterised protein [uncultured archaeon]|nr:Uncharacterised protein [uncultured archaeon]
METVVLRNSPVILLKAEASSPISSSELTSILVFRSPLPISNAAFLSFIIGSVILFERCMPIAVVRRRLRSMTPAVSFSNLYTSAYASSTGNSTITAQSGVPSGAYVAKTELP